VPGGLVQNCRHGQSCGAVVRTRAGGGWAALLRPGRHGNACGPRRGISDGRGVVDAFLSVAYRVPAG